MTAVWADEENNVCVCVIRSPEFAFHHWLSERFIAHVRSKKIPTESQFN